MNKSLIVCALAGMVAAKDEANRVLSIPDMATFDNFGAFSGYLNVSDAKALHYLFFESKNAPETDPVLIWFNGGPGCSSMLARVCKICARRSPGFMRLRLTPSAEAWVASESGTEAASDMGGLDS